MLTNEKVLEAFREYLEEDVCCEPVNTSRGYIVMLLDSRRQRWCDFQEAPTPEALRDVLLENYEGYLMDQMLGERDEPTEEEKRQIEARCRILLERCQ